MYILHTIFLNFVFCSKVISYCNKNVAEKTIFIEYYKTKDITKCITNRKKDVNKKNITYNEGDKITLQCVYAHPASPKKTEKILWKIQQYIYVLIVTPETSLSAYKIFITLDRLDHNLKATCFRNGQESILSNYVYFHHNVNDQKINKDISQGNKKSIQKITYTEGQTVPNNNTTPVLQYVKGLSKEKPKTIEPNKIMFDRITLEDNETLFSVWTHNSFREPTYVTSINIEKHIRVIIVKPIKVVPVPESAFPTVAVVGGVIGLFIIIASIFVYYKYFKLRERTLENYNENIYEEPFQVVYAEMDFKDSSNPAPKLPEEPYAKIIGIIKRNHPPAPLPRNLVHE